MQNCRELLLCSVVLVILAVLCGAAASGRKAFDVRCQNNLKAIHRMAGQYSADNDGYIVRMLERRYNRGIFWSDRLYIYAGDFQNFTCPADEKRAKTALVQDDLLPGRYASKFVSYGINGHLSGVHRKNAPFEKISFMKTPDYTIYFGDAQKLLLRSVGSLWAKDYAPIHDNGMMAVMADGHTGYFNQKNLGTYGKFTGWKQDTKRWKNWRNNQ